VQLLQHAAMSMTSILVLSPAPGSLPGIKALVPVVALRGVKICALTVKRDLGPRDVLGCAQTPCDIELLPHFWPSLLELLHDQYGACAANLLRFRRN
jgi:hypothetical protein